MTTEAEIALTSLAIISTSTAVVSYLWSNFIKKIKMNDSESAHDKSVEIVKEVKKDQQAKRYLTEYDLQYPLHGILKGDLVTRGNWMAARGEKWRYTVEDSEEYGVAAIKLESWLVSRHQHQFLFEYGQVYQTTIIWDSWNIHTNFVVVHPMIPVEDMPRVLEVGPGQSWVVGDKAFVISLKAFQAYRMHPIEEGVGREITIGKRLLFHAIVNRDVQPADFDVASFVGWPAGMVHDLISDHTPGSHYNTYSLEEAGLVEVERGWARTVEEEEMNTRAQGEELLREDSGRKDKEDDEEVSRETEEDEKEIEKDDGPLVKFAFKPTSPPPEMAVGRVYNDTDYTRKRRKRKYKRTPGMRTKMVKSKKRKVAESPKPVSPPINLTKAHEREILRHLVMGIDPKAKAYWTAYHQEVADNRKPTWPEEKEEPYEYGSGPGGWSLTSEEKEEDMKMHARSPNSSVLSPQGELSQNLSSTASGTPCPKKPRKNTGTDSDVSVAMSPFLSMKRSDEKKIISISSEDEGLRKVRVNLGELLDSGRIKWPQDGMMAQIQVEMDEEEIMPDVDTDSGDDDDQAIVLN